MVDRGGETTEPNPLIMKGKRRRHDPEFNVVFIAMLMRWK
jgi:hypothetical protein